MRTKIAIAIVLVVVILGAVFFMSQGDVWHYKIEKEEQWEYVFLASNEIQNRAANASEMDWKKSVEKIELPNDVSNRCLVFRTDFELLSKGSIAEAIIEIPKNYPAEVFVNGNSILDIEPGLITSNTGHEMIGLGLEIEKHWQARKIFIDRRQMDTLFIEGENMMEIVFKDLAQLRSVKALDIPLIFRYNFPSSVWIENEYSPESSSKFQESSLPILKIETSGNAIVNDPKIDAQMTLIDSPESSNYYNDKGIELRIRIEHRGFTSLAFLKKSYGFTTCDQKRGDSLVSLLGLPEESSWVLYGPYKDRSLLRNAFTFSLYAKTGNYSPRTKLVELVVNDNYQGVYILTEKIKISPSRLDLNPLKIDKRDDTLNSSGAYIVEIDRNEWTGYMLEEEQEFVPSKFETYFPKMGKLPNSIQEKIRNQYLEFEKGIVQGGPTNSTFDTLSFADYVIISELSKNVDAYRLSTFIHNKDISDSIPKFYCGPIWDFNYAWGLPDYNNAYSPEGFIYPESEFVPSFWKALIEDSKFQDALHVRYVELRNSIYSDASVDHILDSLYHRCEKPALRNFEKWTLLGSEDFEPNFYTGETHFEEVEQLRSWIHQRLTFLDTAFN